MNILPCSPVAPGLILLLCFGLVVAGPSSVRDAREADLFTEGSGDNVDEETAAVIGNVEAGVVDEDFFLAANETSAKIKEKEDEMTVLNANEPSEDIKEENIVKCSKCLKDTFRYRHDGFCGKCINQGFIDMGEQRALSEAIRCRKCTKSKFRSRNLPFCADTCPQEDDNQTVTTIASTSSSTTPTTTATTTATTTSTTTTASTASTTSISSSTEMVYTTQYYEEPVGVEWIQKLEQEKQKKRKLKIDKQRRREEKRKLKQKRRITKKDIKYGYETTVPSSTKVTTEVHKTNPTTTLPPLGALGNILKYLIIANTWTDKPVKF